MGEHQRCGFHEALLEANGVRTPAGEVAGGDLPGTATRQGTASHSRGARLESYLFAGRQGRNVWRSCARAWPANLDGPQAIFKVLADDTQRTSLFMYDRGDEFDRELPSVESGLAVTAPSWQPRP
jgi:hypothetical protein